MRTHGRPDVFAQRFDLTFPPEARKTTRSCRHKPDRSSMLFRAPGLSVPGMGDTENCSDRDVELQQYCGIIPNRQPLIPMAK